MIMDTDFHHIYQEGTKINLPKSIIIGNHVWRGMRCTLLKGSQIVDGSVIAFNSLVVDNLTMSNSVYGGQPSKLLKQNITWN